MTPDRDFSSAPFEAGTVLKRDVFSETVSGHLQGVPDFPVAMRRIDAGPLWARPLARWLARREGARPCARCRGSRDARC